MKNTLHDDYWPPRQGSWEEAVDPYEVQSSRRPRRRAKHEQELPVESLAEPRPDYRYSTTL